MYVLPEPVWPYAKIVPLKPCITDSTTGCATRSKTSSCVADWSRMPLNAKRQLVRLLFMKPSRLSSGTCTSTRLSASAAEADGVKCVGAMALVGRRRRNVEIAVDFDMAPALLLLLIGVYQGW